MNAKKHALILVNAYASETTRQVARLSAELKGLGVAVDVCRNDKFLTRIQNGKITPSSPLPYDFCVYLDKDKYVPIMLESLGMRLFNSATAVEACDDKMYTHILLAGSGIPMPDTMPGLLCYDPAEKVKSETLDRVESQLGYPIVIKHAFGSLGKGVFKADTRKSLEELAEQVKLLPHLYQKYISPSCGKDLRVIVVGERVLGGILRQSTGDFRSNIGLGGKAEAKDVPAAVCEYALKAARILKLDYCGIDFLVDDGGYLLCEVNSNAFFDAFEKATGVNVAAAYAEYMVKHS